MRNLLDALCLLNRQPSPSLFVRHNSSSIAEKVPGAQSCSCLKTEQELGGLRPRRDKDEGHIDPDEDDPLPLPLPFGGPRRPTKKKDNGTGVRTLFD